MAVSEGSKKHLSRRGNHKAGTLAEKKSLTIRHGSLKQLVSSSTADVVSERRKRKGGRGQEGFVGGKRKSEGEEVEEQGGRSRHIWEEPLSFSITEGRGDRLLIQFWW